MFRSSDILGRPTLVLNRSWQPIHVTTVVRALVMLWNDSAKVVDPDEYRLYAWEEWMTPAARDSTPGPSARGSGPDVDGDRVGCRRSANVGGRPPDPSRRSARFQRAAV